MDGGLLEALRDFVRNGGVLWADGLVGWKNEDGNIRPDLPGGLNKVFGWESYVADVDPVEEPYSVTDAGEMGGELWRIPVQLHDAEVPLKDREGRPFATEHAFDKGKVIYYGAAVALAYFQRYNPRVLEWIVPPASRTNSGSLGQVVKSTDQVGFRSLCHTSGPLAILTNRGRDTEIELQLRGKYGTVSNLLTNSTVKVTHREQSTYAELTLQAGEACVAKANKHQIISSERLLADSDSNDLRLVHSFG